MKEHEIEYALKGKSHKSLKVYKDFNDAHHTRCQKYCHQAEFYVTFRNVFIKYFHQFELFKRRAKAISKNMKSGSKSLIQTS